MQTPFTAQGFRALISEFEREMPAPLLPTWVFGNHDRMRRGERLEHHPEREKLCAALQLSARGIPCIYNGEEIGMQDLDLPLTGANDPVAGIYGFLPEFVASALHRRGILLNRDACRTPMQWSAAPNAGFTTPDAKPWLPVHPSYATTNVEAQQRDPDSILQCYRHLLRLRKSHPALHAGSLSILPENALPPSILGLRRVYQNETIDVLLHFGDTRLTVVLDSKPAYVIGSSYASWNDVRDKRVVLRHYEAVFLMR
jgi:oligo-1,6-glucosidase/alpha-glucosidase